MEFLQLKYFLSAAETENFSHTAARFHVPPSAVSSSIKKLEKELETSLFDRKANRIFLNKRGRIFYECVDSIFQKLDATRMRIREPNEFSGGKITMLIQTNRRLLNKIISDFRHLYPDIFFTLDFKEDREPKTYDLIVTDRIISRTDFEKKPLLQEEICLAVHNSHPLATKKSVMMEDLSQERFICLAPGSSLRSLTDSLCKEALFTPDISIECDDTFYLREYLRMGMGISLIPTVSWKGQLSNEVQLIPIGKGIYRQTNVYRRLNSSAPASVFFDYLLEQIKQTP